MKRYFTSRWLLLGLGLAALVGLTGMNVYTLVRLQQATVQSSQDAQRNKVSEFNAAVANRFNPAVRAFWPLNVEALEGTWRAERRLPDDFTAVLATLSRDSLYAAVYFAPGSFVSCGIGSEVYRFVPETEQLVRIEQPPRAVCDGIGLIRTRVNVLIEEYRWNTKRLFDANRTMNIALINHRGNGIAGYVSLEIDNTYFQRRYLPREMASVFGTREETGISAWIYDWLRGEVVLTNDPTATFERRTVSMSQRFPDILDTWTTAARFDTTPVLVESNNSLWRNLLALGVATLLLVSTIVFMFVLAQRERALALRQAGFLANVTHELKTPIAVMQAAGENLADGRVSDPTRLKAYGTHIQTESMRLRRMIDKLLDVAKTEAGRYPFKPEPYVMADLVDRYLKESGEQADTRLESAVRVVVDRDHFDTILGNLVENARKYGGDTGYVGIRVSRQGRRAVLEVEDRGIGIPPESIKRVFEKFYRVENADTARTKGHGLGLSIVKSLTELNGGRVEVRSTLGSGTTFRISFPITDRTHAN